MFNRVSWNLRLDRYTPELKFLKQYAKFQFLESYDLRWNGIYKRKIVFAFKSIV
jgi:hypothetical protein